MSKNIGLLVLLVLSNPSVQAANALLHTSLERCKEEAKITFDDCLRDWTDYYRCRDNLNKYSALYMMNCGCESKYEIDLKRCEAV